MMVNFGSWKMDITGFTMVLVTRLSGLAFCYKDGGLKDDDLRVEEQERKVVNMPTVLEMLSYTYFCCSCIVGPYYEYVDYINFIEMKGHYEKIPNTVLSSLMKFLKSKCKSLNLV